MRARPGPRSAAIRNRLPATWADTPREVWLLVAARAVNQLGAFTLPFLGVLLTTRLGASVERAGLALALFGVATIPSRLVGGWLADRCGRRTTIIAGLSSSAIGQLLVAGSSTLAQATAAAAILGLAFEIYESPSQAMIGDVVEPAARPAAYGLMAAALAVAGMASGLVAIVIGHLDLRLLFVADAATCLTCAALVRATLPRDRRPDPGTGGDEPSGDVRATCVSAWRDRLLLLLLIGGTGFAIVYFQIMVTLPLTLVERGLPGNQFGLLLTVSALTVVAAHPLLRVTRLRAQTPTAAMATGHLLCAAGLLGYAFASSLTGFVAVTVVFSLGDLMLLGRGSALVSCIGPASTRGRYLAIYGLGWGVAAVVAPLAGTQALSRLGIGWTWTGCASVSATLALLHLLLKPTVTRRLTAWLPVDVRHHGDPRRGGCGPGDRIAR